MRIRYAGRMWDVRLEDDGTLDTVVSVTPFARSKTPLRKLYHKVHTEVVCCEAHYTPQSDGFYELNPLPSDFCCVCGKGAFDYPRQEIRFDGEYVSEYRRPSGEMTMRGLRILGQEAAEAYDAVEI